MQEYNASCKEMERKIHFYLDQELSEEETLVVRKHLNQCSHCYEEHSYYHALREKVKKETASFVAPVHLQAKISSSLRAQKEPSKIPWWVVASAAALFLFVSGNLLQTAWTTHEKTSVVSKTSTIAKEKRIASLLGSTSKKLGASLLVTADFSKKNRWIQKAKQKALLGVSKHSLIAKPSSHKSDLHDSFDHLGTCSDPVPSGVQAAFNSSLSVTPASYSGK